MSLNIVVKADAPETPYTTELIEFQTQVTPFALYGIWLKSQRYFWLSLDDWNVAKSLLSQVGSEMLMPVGQDIVNAVDRLYTLIDVRLAGIERTSTGNGTVIDPYIYDPVLYQTPEIFDDEPRSLIGLATDSRRAWRNLLNGTDSADYADTRNFRQQLEDLLAQDSEDDIDIASIIALLTEAGIDIDALLLLLA